MKPIEVGFDGTLSMKVGSYIPFYRLARSIDKDKGPDVWHTSCNDNINGNITNTLIWWGKEDGPELFYRNKDGKLFTVNFEPWENNS